MTSSSLSMFLTSLKAAPAALLRRKILVVDSSEKVTALLADVFTDAGACVTETSDIHEAMLFIAWGGYDLIVINPASARDDAALRFIRDSRPELLSRTLVLTSNVPDYRALPALKALFPNCSFQPFVLVNLVNYACDVLSIVTEKHAA